MQCVLLQQNAILQTFHIIQRFLLNTDYIQLLEHTVYRTN